MSSHKAESSPIDSIRETVADQLEIDDFYLENNTPTFLLDPDQPIQTRFESLSHTLKERDLMPVLREEEGKPKLRIVGRRDRGSGSSKIFLVLLVATIIAVSVDGFLRSQESLWNQVAQVPMSNVIHTALFSVSLIGIIAVHESGHLLSLKLSDMESTPPYFIPGIPTVTIPTMGAIILQRDVPANRNRLFDLGFSGPIAGLVATIAATVYAAATAVPAPQGALPSDVSFLPVPILYQAIQSLVNPMPGDAVVVTNLVGFAAWLGMLITFLNTLPAWQLDGGHMATAVLGEEAHKYATYISIVVMAAIGFIEMALLVLVLYFLTGGRPMPPLDTYTDVSRSRKMLFASSLVISFLTAPINLPFL